MNPAPPVMTTFTVAEGIRSPSGPTVFHTLDRRHLLLARRHSELRRFEFDLIGEDAGPADDASHPLLTWTAIRRIPIGHSATRIEHHEVPVRCAREQSCQDHIDLSMAAHEHTPTLTSRASDQRRRLMPVGPSEANHG